MDKKSAFFKFAEKNYWLLILLVTGLLLLSTGSDRNKNEPGTIATDYEQRLSGALSRMEGVGSTYVLLSEKPGRDAGFSGAVVVCAGADDPAVRLRVVEAVRAFTSLGSDKIVVQKMIS